MKTYFCDTSAIIKLYHAEIETNFMDSVFADSDISMIISELTIIEFSSAIARKVRVGEISVDARKEAIRNFDKDCRNRFIIKALDTGIVKTAREIIDRHGDRSSIRTLDAIQLSAYLSEISDVFVCADVNLISICRLEGVSAINPESPPPSL